ncbi:glucose 1-dehydrogenase [Alkalihalobacillus oceani]|uniref:SDR family NAD(P)-dependent oxidoreductase n=1 Tax=Halalkalibacter oceani TaxID=1653776 RepID=UPI00203AE728|nr:glucose 1-dehydrogenase [Halalkalibacter oceani]MCM3759610.1 glucose 1-dehydrogenase [Halalkalibacter oceani]
MKGKVAIVTGSSSGIGRMIALRLAMEGVNITINYSSSKDRADEVKAEIEKLGVKCIVVQGSVADERTAEKLVNETLTAFGQIDILVNNAGTTHFVEHDDLQGMRSEYWDNMMGVNVKGMFFCCRAASDQLRRQKGCIINITSVAGQTGLGSSIGYAASKAAANSITKSLARVLAPEVRVNSLAPGVVATRWIEGHEKQMKELSEATPLGRMATPEDVAEAAFGLIAHSPFVTGEILRVDGGMFIN